MFQQSFNFIAMILIGLLFCFLGFSFIFGSLGVWNWLYIIFVASISIIIVLKICNLIFNFKVEKHKITSIYELIIWCILIFVAFFSPNIFYIVLPKLIGVWILFHAVVKIIVIYVKLKDNLKISIFELLFLFGDLCMSSFLLGNPIRHTIFINIVTGLYFIIYGFNSLIECIREYIPSNEKIIIKKKIRLAVNPLISAIIPPHLLYELLDQDNEEEINERFNSIKEEIPIDLEVMIHIAPSGPAMLGHTDLIYKDHVISYGCYDPHNRYLFGTLGDGVILVAEKNSYLYNCLKNENKVLISFGLTLTKEQKKNLNKKFKEVFSDVIDFYSDEDLKNRGLPYKGTCDDYISRVSRNSPNVKFYKLKEGKMKTFFVLYTNCVYFMANFLKEVGLNLFDLSGIISPGAYYDFMNKQFKSNKSFVISRKVFRKKDAEKFLEKSN